MYSGVLVVLFIASQRGLESDWEVFTIAGLDATILVLLHPCIILGILMVNFVLDQRLRVFGSMLR